MRCMNLTLSKIDFVIFFRAGKSKFEKSSPLKDELSPAPAAAESSIAIQNFVEETGTIRDEKSSTGSQKAKRESSQQSEAVRYHLY